MQAATTRPEFNAPPIPSAGEQDSRQQREKALGQHLRQSRQLLDKDIDAAADETNIMLAHLQALEAGDWDALPGEVYGRGYVKRYADYLGLHVQETLDMLQAAPIAPAPIVTPILTQRHSPVNLRPVLVWGSVVLAGLVIGVLLAGMQGQTNRLSPVRPVPERLAHYVPELTAIRPTFYHHCLQEVRGQALWPCYFAHYVTHPFLSQAGPQ